MSDIKIITSWDEIPPVMYDGPDGDACSMLVLENNYRVMETQLSCGIHTSTDTCQRPMCVLRREKAELQQENLDLVMSLRNLEEQLKEAHALLRLGSKLVNVSQEEAKR